MKYGSGPAILTDAVVGVHTRIIAYVGPLGNVLARAAVSILRAREGNAHVASVGGT